MTWTIHKDTGAPCRLRLDLADPEGDRLKQDVRRMSQGEQQETPVFRDVLQPGGLFIESHMCHKYLKLLIAFPSQDSSSLLPFTDHRYTEYSKIVDMVGSYQRADHKPYKIIYKRPGADLVITRNSPSSPSPALPTEQRYVTGPTESSCSVIEVEEVIEPTSIRSSAVIRRSITTRDRSAETYNSKAAVKRPLTTVTGKLSTRVQRTSSKTGTLLFAYGPDLSPAHFDSKCDLTHPSSSRPVALAKLTGWRWFVSARGTPNIFPLGTAGIYNDDGRLRKRQRSSDANIVYGLVYHVHVEDENKVDVFNGYKEHGPVNTALDSKTVETTPFLQGHNLANKRYERLEVVAWLTDPLAEHINVVRDALSVICLIYVDGSSQGLRPGRLWDDQVRSISRSVTGAVRNYGLSRQWVESVMGMYGIHIVQNHANEVDVRVKEEKESSWDMIKYQTPLQMSNNSDSGYGDGDESIVETRITKRITEDYKPLPRSDFCREKKGTRTRYISL